MHYSLMDELMADPKKPMPVAWRTNILTKMHQGLEAIERGEEPSKRDWRVLSDCVNLMETLVLEMKVLEDPGGLLMDGVTALAMAGKRNLAGGQIRLDGPGIQAVRAILDDFGQAIDVLPARTMIRAHRLTEKRISEILKGRRKPQDVEVVDL